MAGNDLIGNAGVYWVVSELSLRGLVALPTVRNCPGADVVVLDPATGQLATLQVKTSGKRPSFWPAGEPPEHWRRPTHHYVFLRRTADFSGFEAFLADSLVVAASIRATVEWEGSRGRRPFPCFVLPGSPAGRDAAGVESLREAWKSWRPSAR
jgi:hypothetical protein